MLTQYKAIKKGKVSDPSLNDGSSDEESTRSSPKNNCIDKKIIKEVFFYTFSNSLGPSIDAASHFVNILILANKTLPASALIGSYQNLITTTGCMMLGTTCSLVSNAYGERENTPELSNAKIRYYLKGGILFALLISIPAVASSFLSKPVLKLCQQPEELLDDVQDYFYAYALGMPAIFIVHLEKQIALGVSDVRAVNLLGLFDSPAISLLGYLLVNGKLGGKELGVAGLGLAASILNWVELIFFSLYFKYSQKYKDYKLDLFSELASVKLHLKEIFYMGLPSGMQSGSEFLFLLGNSALCGKLGIYALTSYQIVSQYILLAMIPSLGLSQTAIFLTGRENGAQRVNNAKTIGNFCITIGGSASLLMCILMAVMPKTLMKPLIDIDNPENIEVIESARLLFIIKGIANIFDTIRLIAAGAIQGGFKNTKSSMLASIIAVGLVGLTLSYFLGFFTDLELSGIGLGQCLGATVGGTFLLVDWLRRSRSWSSNLQLHDNESSIETNIVDEMVSPEESETTRPSIEMHEYKDDQLSDFSYALENNNSNSSPSESRPILEQKEGPKNDLSAALTIKKNSFEYNRLSTDTDEDQSIPPLIFTSRTAPRLQNDDPSIILDNERRLNLSSKSAL